jgi:hypothetical protein
MRVLRILRGALILGGVWAAVWLPVGFVFAAAMGWIAFPARSDDWIGLGFWTGIGFVSGSVFALLLSGLERGKTVDTLSRARLARWGALAGAGVPIGLSALVLALGPNVHLGPGAFRMFALLGVTGAATALATVRLAKRAGQPGELGESGPRVSG